MATTTVNIPVNRDFLLPLVLVPLVLAALWYYVVPENAPVPSPEDVIDIVFDDVPLNIPDEFKKTLIRLEVEGFALVDKQGRLRAYNKDGTPHNMCGQGSEADKSGSCKLVIKPKELMLNLNNTVACRRCKDGIGNLRSCHKGGPNINKYPRKGNHKHFRCFNRCK